MLCFAGNVGRIKHCREGKSLLKCPIWVKCIPDGRLSYDKFNSLVVWTQHCLTTTVPVDQDKWNSSEHECTIYGSLKSLFTIRLKNPFKIQLNGLWFVLKYNMYWENVLFSWGQSFHNQTSSVCQS